MRATHAGALAVLSKPFDQKMIMKMVREVVHRKQETLIKSVSISPWKMGYRGLNSLPLGMSGVRRRA